MGMSRCLISRHKVCTEGQQPLKKDSDKHSTAAQWLLAITEGRSGWSTKKKIDTCCSPRKCFNKEMALQWSCKMSRWFSEGWEAWGWGQTGSKTWVGSWWSSYDTWAWPVRILESSHLSTVSLCLTVSHHSRNPGQARREQGKLEEDARSCRNYRHSLFIIARQRCFTL